MDQAAVVLVADDEARREGLALGAADYITKPFHPADLVARVGAALGAGGASTPAQPP